jgi:hypothetical protein
MTKHLALLVSGLALLALAYTPNVSAAAASVPGSLTQQGRLLDAAGNPVDGVALEFTFALYTAATGAANTAIWTEKQTITPDGGYFSARLGESAPFPATIFDGSRGTLFLGITIGTDAEMAPRQELTSVPFALLAGNALNANHAAQADAATGALDTRIAALETAVSALQTNVGTLQGSVNTLSGAPHAYGSSYFFTGTNDCATAGLECPVDISAGHFTAPPTCASTNAAPDATGYNENVVIRAVTATTLYVWKGQYLTSGFTLSGTFICIGT